MVILGETEELYTTIDKQSNTPKRAPNKSKQIVHRILSSLHPRNANIALQTNVAPSREPEYEYKNNIRSTKKYKK